MYRLCLLTLEAVSGPARARFSYCLSCSSSYPARSSTNHWVPRAIGRSMREISVPTWMLGESRAFFSMMMPTTCMMRCASTPVRTVPSADRHSVCTQCRPPIDIRNSVHTVFRIREKIGLILTNRGNPTIIREYFGLIHPILVVWALIPSNKVKKRPYF